MNNISEYCIAEHNIRVVFTANDRNSPELIASFEPFRTKGSNDDFLFTLHVDDTLKPITKEHRERIDTFDTGNGDTIVDQLDNGGYQYILKDIEGRSCCLLQTNKDFSEGVRTERQRTDATLRTEQRTDDALRLSQQLLPHTAHTRLTRQKQRLRLCVHRKKRHRQEHTHATMAEAHPRVGPDERRQPHRARHRRKHIYLR